MIKVSEQLSFLVEEEERAVMCILSTDVMVKIKDADHFSPEVSQKAHLKTQHRLPLPHSLGPVSSNVC